MNLSDVKDAIRAFEKEPNCGLMLNGGACLFKPACKDSCKFLAEASKPSNPYTNNSKSCPEHEGSRFDADQERAEQSLYDEYQNHPERFR
jgi:hypothetical protein